MDAIIFARMIAGSSLLGSLAFGCGPTEAAPTNICEQATQVFTRCGVTLPLNSTSGCTGVSRLVARCVAHHAHKCEELATLVSRVDMCVADEIDGGATLLPSADDLPVPTLPDAKFDGEAKSDASSDGSLDAREAGL
ncbi:MAG: hypothetical protein NVS3B20_27630 [Polyangiales bacterium]